MITHISKSTGSILMLYYKGVDLRQHLSLVDFYRVRKELLLSGVDISKPYEGHLIMIDWISITPDMAKSLGVNDEN